MAMHKSEELREVVYEFFEQLQPLGLAKWGFQLRIAREDENGFNIWISTPAERILPDQYHIPTLDHWVLRKYWDAYKQQLDQVTIEVTGDDKLKLDLLLFEKSDVKNFSEEVKKSILAYDYVQFSVASMRYGLLEAIDVEPIPEEKFEILKRYAKVFEQTYTRFLDLKKAEAQAREAQIESALERVRSRSMAMQKSAELKDIVHKLSNEIGRLDVIFNRIFICIFDPATLGSTWWMSNPESGESFGLFIKYHEHFPYQEHIKAWRERKVAWQYILKGQDKKEWDAFLFTETDLSLLPETIRHSMRSKMQVYLSCSFNNFGYLVLESSEPLSSTQFDILSRFAKTFDQSYTRFLDIQKAEVQAREAVKQASLDRVRGEIASMRTSEDLNRITPVIWHELKALEVPFFRCGVFIVDDETKKIDTYLSNPEGESLATWRSDYDTIPLFKASVKAWKKQQVYRTEWNKKQFIAFSQTLIDHGLVRDVKRFQEGEEAPNYLSLQMIPFKQGMLYVGSAEKLNNDQIELVQALASAFSIAYSRYEDFRQLEKVKNDVEHALTELRSTQTQLIHSEKMASLGELTAGIAHEIQNPLNFVNNFSEVSADLLEDMVEGILIGNMEEVKAITEDLRQNLEKINHHGKRASDIVKGMLQHSRSNSGRKEAVDINLLAEEYLRLAYHGLRAKDKSFNADFKTDLDESIPKINVSGQDLGRVFLNLINNAFYAVSEKQIKEGKDYKPIVKLTTRRMSPDGEGQGEENIRISIKDNGPGIPEIIRDKIFQPFFTTKPTGQGTGLGLSLSYDIITKGHHGSLEVVTEEGSGTEFIIILPIN
jgi:signal transduction histidine kinase